MDFGTLMNAGKELLDKNGANGIESAVQELLAGKDGKMDLQSVVSGIQDPNLNALVASWLGDGENMKPSVDDVAALLGNEKIASVAEKFGLNSSGIMNSLQTILPQLIDGSSKGGSLLDNLGDTNAVADLAARFFRT